MTPDRISEYKRGERQQEAYYDTKGWMDSLEGKGLKRSGEGGEGQGEGEEKGQKKLKKGEVVSCLFLGGIGGEGREESTDWFFGGERG